MERGGASQARLHEQASPFVPVFARAPLLAETRHICSAEVAFHVLRPLVDLAGLHR